jgi:hypothetical protein
MAKNSSSSSSSSSKNQPTGESGEAGCDDSVGRLVGRLVSLYREKTGEPFDWTQEQSRGVKELASAYGEPDAIATFEEWLKRPRGTGGLDWPLAQFIAEYAGYSPALQQAIGDAIAQGKAQDATGQPDGRGRAALPREYTARDRVIDQQRWAAEGKCLSCGSNEPMPAKTPGLVHCGKCGLLYALPEPSQGPGIGGPDEGAV